MSVEPYYADDQVSLRLGDCLDILPSLPDASVDAVVTDPPYGLAELSTAVVLQAIAAWMAGDRTHVPDGRGFMGREACVLEGFSCILIEQDPAAADLARVRLSKPIQPGLFGGAA